MTDKELQELREQNFEDARDFFNIMGYKEKRYTIIHKLLDEIDRLKAERQWISVDDRLPEAYKIDGSVNYVLGWYMGIERLKGEMGAVCITLSNLTMGGDHYTHWMPAPEPPE